LYFSVFLITQSTALMKLNPDITHPCLTSVLIEHYSVVCPFFYDTATYRFYCISI
jgi:hypothetical protein